MGATFAIAKAFQIDPRAVLGWDSAFLEAAYTWLEWQATLRDDAAEGAKLGQRLDGKQPDNVISAKQFIEQRQKAREASGG